MRLKIFLFICALIFLGYTAMNWAKISGRAKSKILHDIAHTYVREVVKWQPGTYKVRFMGKRDQYYIMSGWLLQDVEDRRNYRKQHPEINMRGPYPSEFMLLIDFEKREIVEATHVGQKYPPRP